MSDLRIVLLGKTGAGKSASGNTIICGNRETFNNCFSSQSGTRICRAGQTEVNKHKITVIDTIGFADTSLSPSSLQNKSDQIFDCTLGEDIDVFLLVIKLGDRYTQEEQNIVKLIQETFGAKALKHTIVLFTHGDLFHEPVEMYLSEHDTLRSVVDQCSGGYHVFDNKTEDQTQVTELLRKIEILRMKNVNKKYTKQDYEKTQIERLEHQRAQKESLEYERVKRARLERERAQRARLEHQRAQRERLEHQRAEKERLEHERAQREHLEHQRAQRERLELQRAQREHLEHQRAEKERLEHERAQRERLEHQRAQRERLEHERAQREHHGLSTEAVLGSVVGGVLAAAVVGVLYILKN